MKHLLHPASRRQCRMRLLLQGSSGSGKTMSALLVAYGLAGDWAKVAIIDSERGSAHLYADLGAYQVLPLTAPFTPERYMDALATCEQAGMEVIILDSITHCWEYLLDYHASLPGNSFTAWSKVTPRHNAFVDRLLRSPAHIIATVRSKTEYALSEKNGKQVPEKLGMKSIQRDGLDYEFSLVFELDAKHHAVASKDRTRLFVDQPPFRLGEGTGQALLEWCAAGLPAPESEDDVRQSIRLCQTLDELLALYYRLEPAYQVALKAEFQDQKQHLQTLSDAPSSVGNNKLFTQPSQLSTHGNLAHSA
ncbi:AAA family ATPase [Hymenobacter chitinivorans]|uniref:AAA domain-containing protein n=1 Tax=Hymenobacter chitinivorans DSM 11115 TaxID=1121954 RepID=A0A2M9BAH6_9BACT|nr:AAA family ATPase [Hymenobacter chitinivorans]PJJ54935.1 AAA domain-containing protein [Hymenobacter chitinivorans DSM 11115]